VEKINIQTLKESLNYLESKQRQLNRLHETDSRSLESIIKYTKKDMIERFNLLDFDSYIKQEIENTDTFISIVKNIIETNS
jgi:prefoldin subunit 5